VGGCRLPGVVWLQWVSIGGCGVELRRILVWRGVRGRARCCVGHWLGMEGGGTAIVGLWPIGMGLSV
jgi:hypothetical protein